MEASPSEIRRVGVVVLSWVISAKGASFCQVDIISPVVSVNPWRTSGSQKCIGAKPNLIARAIVIVEAGRGCESSRTFHSPVIQALVVLANRIIAAAVACVRKYFVVASTARGWWCCAIRGRMARVLISSPIQASNQCELANVRVVPSPKLINRKDKI